MDPNECGSGCKITVKCITVLPSHSWCSLHSIVPEIKYMKINKKSTNFNKKNHETSQTKGFMIF